ncbi:TMEM165/GDT1 family protein [Candidatus Bipolaricaulota bacterium]|nr:TMEM165/GDT1 family protein [Candidatus Bipolaricaulota bacterium]MCK5584993.1 TMEM165/GDT1 family protein [Candidatus Bipolaricaulota bacterium]
MIRTILTTFALVFLAELGDKTQLAVLAMASRSSPWAVFVGAGAALLVSTLLAVVLGCTLPRFLPTSSTKILHYIAGSLFVIVGAWTIWKA